MEIPILLGANPKIADPSVWIPIRFDCWTVRVEGLVDSEITLHANGPFKNSVKIMSFTTNGAIYRGPCQVRVEFRERGTEKAITIFAVEHR